MKIIKEKTSSVLKAAPSSLNEKARTIQATISTNEVDRDGEVVEPKAFEEKIDSFKANPVFLWMHDATQPPIGKVTELEFKKDRLDAELQFRDEGKSELADDVFSLFQEGILKTFSIGFRVFKMEFETDDDGDELPPRITSAELFEVSAVPIPANPGAVAKMHKLGIGGPPRFYMKQRGPVSGMGRAIPDGEILQMALDISERLIEKRLAGESIPLDQYARIQKLKFALLTERNRKSDSESVRVLADAVDCIDSTLSMVR